MFITKDELSDIKKNMGSMAEWIKLLNARVESLEKEVRNTPKRGFDYSLNEVDKLFWDRIEAIKEYLKLDWKQTQVPDPCHIPERVPYVEKCICVKHK